MSEPSALAQIAIGIGCVAGYLLVGCIVAGLAKRFGDDDDDCLSMYVLMWPLLAVIMPIVGMVLGVILLCRHAIEFVSGRKIKRPLGG